MMVRSRRMTQHTSLDHGGEARAKDRESERGSGKHCCFLFFFRLSCRIPFICSIAEQRDFEPFR